LIDGTLEALLAACLAIAGGDLNSDAGGTSVKSEPLVVIQYVVRTTGKGLLLVVVVDGAAVAVQVQTVGQSFNTGIGRGWRAWWRALGENELAKCQEDEQYSVKLFHAINLGLVQNPVAGCAFSCRNCN